MLGKKGDVSFPRPQEDETEMGGGAMKQWADIIKNVSMLTQFGLSLLTPLLLCLGLCWWLTSRFDLGGWVYIFGFFFGLGGSGMVAYKLYLSETQHRKKEEKKDKISFNRHS